MTTEKAARGSGNYTRAKSVAETRSIVSNAELFRTAVLSTLFVAALMLVPTAMAAAKAAGWW